MAKDKMVSQTVDIAKSVPESPKTKQELGSLLEKVETSSNVHSNLGSLEGEMKGQKFIDMLIKFFINPEGFMSTFFGGPTETEKTNNTNAWEKFKNEPLFGFFEEMKDVYELDESTVNPNEFNEKFEDEEFREIMEFQKKSGKKYSQESLAILWANKDNLSIENSKLIIKKPGGSQEINVEDDKSLAKSIISKESLAKKIPQFSKHLKQSLTNYFSGIPEKYKKLIPPAIDKFEAELKVSASSGKLPNFSRDKILSCIEAVHPLGTFKKLIVTSKMNNFLSSREGNILKKEYENLLRA